MRDYLIIFGLIFALASFVTFVVPTLADREAARKKAAREAEQANLKS